MAQNRVAAIERYLFDSASLSGGFDEFCAGLDEPCFLVRIVNACNRPVSISYDGTGYHDYVPAGDVLQLSFQANSRPGSKVALMAKGQKFYLVGNAGTGYIYLIGYYSIT